MQRLGRSVAIVSTTTIALVVVLVACTGGGGLSATISNPTATAYTNGDLAIQVTVGGAPESVELRIDGAPLATLQPPYTYTWATTGVDEGSYELVAVARQGGRSATSAPRTVVVDRTRPIVTDRTPAPNASNVWHAAPIEVRVSEPLLASTVTSGSVALDVVGGAPLAATIDLSADGETIRVTPTAAIPVPSELRLTLSEAVTDLAGNALVAPPAWTWELPFWQWMGSERLNVDPAVQPLYSAITLTPDDRPIVTWLEDKSNSQPPVDVYASSWSGEAWEALGGRVNGDDRTGAMYTVLTPAAVDAAGVPYVAWTSSTSLKQGWVQRWNGAAWESVGGGHFTGAAQSENSVALVLDAQGHPVVAWVARTAAGVDGQEVRVSRWTGSDWVQLGTARRRAPDRGAFLPHIVLGADGRPVVAWTERIDDSPGSATNVFVDRWTGSDWEPLGGSLRFASNTALLPRLALDEGTGAIHVAHLVGANSDDLRLAVRRWDASGEAWETLGTRRTGAATTVSAGTLAVDGSGRAVATWVERRPADGGGSTYFTVTERHAGAQWASLGDAHESYWSLADVAVDGAGIVYRTVHVRDTDPAHPHVRVQRSNGAP